MALTLNGIAQGYIADRVTALLRSEGLTDILVNTGEIAALGAQPDGTDWPVDLPDGTTIGLRHRAVASSAPLGTVFDKAGKIGHILDPRTGMPAQSPWRLVSVSSQSAAVADALSTAACLLPGKSEIAAALAQFADTRLEALA